MRWIFKIMSTGVKRITNNILYFFEKNNTNLNTFFFFIFIISWITTYNKLQNLQLNILKREDFINNSHYISTLIEIKKFISGECTRVVKEIHLPPEESMLNLKKILKKEKVDIDLIYKIILEKKEKNLKVAIWEGDWQAWKEFINLPQNIIKEFPNRNELKENESILNLYKNEEKILKKTKFKLVIGLGLLVSIDFFLKIIFN